MTFLVRTLLRHFNHGFSCVPSILFAKLMLVKGLIRLEVIDLWQFCQSGLLRLLTKELCTLPLRLYIWARTSPTTWASHSSSFIRLRLSVRTAHPSPLTKISSWHPKGVRRSFFDKKLNLFKVSFRLYGIKHQIDGNHLYYFSYFATFSLLFQKLLGSLVKTPIC